MLQKVIIIFFFPIMPIFHSPFIVNIVLKSSTVYELPYFRLVVSKFEWKLQIFKRIFTILSFPYSFSRFLTRFNLNILKTRKSTIHYVTNLGIVNRWIKFKQSIMTCLSFGSSGITSFVRSRLNISSYFLPYVPTFF